MKAVQFAEYGDASKVIINEVDQPSPGPSQVLVEVRAASLNPFDSKLRAGNMKAYIPLKLPITLGGDLAGVIREVGEDVTAFKAGDQVYGQANAVAGDSGAFAEYAVTKAEHIALAPKEVSLGEAASLPLVGVSALQALEEHIKLSPGQSIFVQGGSGGIGSAAIQLAKDLGAHVATAVSADAKDYAESLGADEVFDYKTVNIEDKLENYDAILDLVGGEAFARSLDILKPGGIAVTLVGPVDKALGEDQDVTVIAMGTKVTSEALEELARHIDDGVITPHIDKEFPLEEAREAFAVRENERILGKVILVVK